MEPVSSLESLPDAVLRDRLRGLAGVERRALAIFLRHLAEADRRDVSRDWGFPSLFYYCTEELRHSEAAAYKRITAARKAAQFPALLELVEKGELHLEGILILAPHINAGNQANFLEEARGKSKRALEALVAELVPRPDKRDCVMRLPEVAQSAAAPAGLPPPRPIQDEPPKSATHDCAPRGRVEVLSPGRMHLGLTISAALWEKLQRIRGLLRHKHPGGRLESVLDEMADIYLESKDPERRARRRMARRSAVGRKFETNLRKARPAIPLAVRDAVFLRDGGRCVFESADGRRCASREGLEIDHKVPRAMGGADDAGNLRLLCRAHNQFAARKALGPDKVGPHRRMRRPDSRP